MPAQRLPWRVLSGALYSSVLSLQQVRRRGQGGKEKAWTDCVEWAVRAFYVSGDWRLEKHGVEGGRVVHCVHCAHCP